MAAYPGYSASGCSSLDMSSASNSCSLKLGKTATGGAYYVIAATGYNNTISIKPAGSSPTAYAEDAIALIEEPDSLGNAYSVWIPASSEMSGTISQIIAGSPDFTYINRDSAAMKSDTYKTQYVDLYGVFAEKNIYGQDSLKLWYPDTQATMNFFVLGPDGFVISSSGGITISGEGASVATDNTKIYFDDYLKKSGARYAFTASDLPTTLRSGTLEDPVFSTLYDYDQYIELSDDFTVQFMQYIAPPTGTTQDPELVLRHVSGSNPGYAATDNYVYKTKVVFDKGVGVTGVIGESVELFGKTYIIAASTNFGATTTTTTIPLTKLIAIDFVSGKSLYIRNIGTGIINKYEINVYINNALVACDLTPSNIVPSSVASCNLSTFCNTGDTIKVTAPSNMDLADCTSPSTTTTTTPVKKLPPCDSYGDVNNDGYITNVDADMISNYVVGNISLTSLQKIMADVNRDGNVTSVDAMFIGQYVAGTRNIFFTACAQPYLTSGWNSFASALSEGIFVDELKLHCNPQAIYRWNPDTKQYLEEKTKIEAGVGYYIALLESCTLLNIPGNQYALKSISISPGKIYFIGSQFNTVKVSDILGTCRSDNLNVFIRDYTTGNYAKVDTLQPWKGYWINSSINCTFGTAPTNATLYGACVVRDSYTSLPNPADPDLGTGYAKINLGAVSSYNDVKNKCTDSIFSSLMDKYCTKNKNNVQWGVAVYPTTTGGVGTTSGCAASGCNFHSCPQNTTTTTTIPTCTDSDGGIKYYMKGWVQDYYDVKPYYDYCTLDGAEISSCTDPNQNCGIIEKYCTSYYRRSGHYIYGDEFDEVCPYGCRDGACLVKCNGTKMVWYVNTTEIRRESYNYTTDSCSGYRCLMNNIISPACYNFVECQNICSGECVYISTAKNQCILESCVDSDGGKNYYVKGTTYGPYVNNTDSCYQDVIGLQEQYCTSGGQQAAAYYNCPNGCSNGACLKTCPARIETNFSKSEYSVGDDGYFATRIWDAEGKLITNQKFYWDVYVNDTLYIGAGNGITSSSGVYESRGTVDAYLLGVVKVITYLNATGCDRISDTDYFTVKSKETLCKDSDGGKNYYVKGYITVNGINSWDECNPSGTSANTLLEYYCTGDPNQPGLGNLYICPYGCKDGACIKPYMPIYAYMKTDKPRYKLSESVSIGAVASGDKTALDQLKLAAKVTKPDSSTDIIDLESKICGCAASSEGMSDCSCEFSGAAFTETYNTGFYRVDGVRSDSAANISVNIYGTSFQVFDPSVLEKYLILKDIEGYIYYDSSTASAPYPYNGTLYMALYNKDGKQYIASAISFESIEKMQEFLNKALESEYLNVKQSTIEGYQVYIIKNRYSTDTLVLWTNKNFAIYVAKMPTYQATVTKAVEKQASEQLQVTETSATGTKEAVQTPKGSLLTGMVVAETSVATEPVEEELLPLPLIGAYLNMYPSDLAAIGTECDDHGGYCAAAEIGCKEGYENSEYSCHTAEVCCLKTVSSTDIMNMALKLETLKAQLTKMKKVTDTIAKFYDAQGNISQKIKFENISKMFETAIIKIDILEKLIKDNVNDITAVRKEIYTQISDLKAYIKEILLAILSS